MKNKEIQLGGRRQLGPCGSKLFVMFHFDTAAYMSKDVSYVSRFCNICSFDLIKSVKKETGKQN